MYLLAREYLGRAGRTVLVLIIGIFSRIDAGFSRIDKGIFSRID